MEALTSKDEGDESMDVKGFTGVIMVICEWVMRLAVVNLLWMLGTLVGLGVFGIMPATISLFTVTRKWMLGDLDVPIFKTFVSTYKKEFIKSNLAGLLFAFVAYVLYIDFLFVSTLEGMLHTVLMVALLTAVLCYCVIVLYFFPLYVHYELKLFQYFKRSLLLGLIRPFSTIMIVIALATIYIPFLLFPALIPFFGVSLGGYVIMYISYRLFTNIAKKQEELTAQGQTQAEA
ncbi:YesL family protein [Bacillus alkalicellulosilyticus]|uniref:YesL family protein n=1 Tax=Alkalihalobacterium alkalicellulosilyticum TaxID=1912214 RepID=UPI00099602EE|nr:DUF624 domain-containing protein [Bacillus alkalicellulosilyticus]